MMPIHSKPSLLLKERAYQYIREAILKETFLPGEILSERRLIDCLGMSKTPIKSALDRLEVEGFVRVAPKQGIVVNELSVEKARDIFELRMALELFVCELVSGRLKKGEIALIEQNLELQRRAVAAGDDLAFTEADSNFHILLVRFSGNAEIHSVMTMYQAHLYRSAIKVIRRVPNRMEAAYLDHWQMFKSLVDGDVERAKHLVRDHLHFGRAILTD